MVNQTANYIGTFYSVMMTIRTYLAYFILEYIKCKYVEKIALGF